MVRHQLLAAACVLILGLSSAQAGKGRRVGSFDNHPTGGKGGIHQGFEWIEGDARFKIEPAGSCKPAQRPGAVGILGGTLFEGTTHEHPDPRLKDPTAVCAHGVVLLVVDAHTGTRPLSILPIIRPTGDGQKQTVADSSRVVRGVLPKLDKPEGDKVPEVVQVRQAVRTMDAAHASRFLPRRLRDVQP